jgi:hypothetical protein
MIVPEYWSEARRQHRSKGKQVTVRRFGWSMTSQNEADSLAEERVGEALRLILKGEKLARSEPKVPYNGAEGVPIREEVLERHGEAVITRNSYGAHCLNSPNALFADIDIEHPSPFLPGCILFIAFAAGSFALGWRFDSWVVAGVLLFLSLIFAWPIANSVLKIIVMLIGGPEQVARRRIERFMERNPDWNLRVYRTPAGFRLLATHQPFIPSSAEVQEFFAAIQADPIYVAMCLNQQCFRARLTAKPWRIGIPSHMRPRPGVWPVAPERMQERTEWIENYEKRAAGFAACSYVDSIGIGTIHPSLRSIVELHDSRSRALATTMDLA